MKHRANYARHCISSYCNKLINLPGFEAVVLVVIFANCVVLATDDPTKSEQQKWQEVADAVFQSLYTLELLIKVFAMGFVFNKGAYLRDPWNIFDFFIIGFGYLEYLSIDTGGFDLRPLRVLRVLRTIRRVTSIEGVNTLFTALINSFGSLLYVGIIYIFFLVLFAIAGFQLWNNSLKDRCRSVATSQFDDTDTLCGRFSCPAGYECAYYGSSPNFGLSHFDNFLASFLVVFTTSTGEGWGKIQKAVVEVHGSYVVIFFEAILVIEFYFLQNFVLSILKHNVSQLHEENKKNSMLPFITNTMKKYKSLSTFRKTPLNPKSPNNGNPLPNP